MRIEQRTATDCGIATLANALNLTYEQAEAEYGFNRTPGVTIQETCAVLHANGYIPVYLPLPGFQKLTNLQHTKTLSLQAFENKNHPAILQVVSNGVLHQVYFDGKKIIDPSPRCPDPMDFEDYELIVDCVFVIKGAVGLGV